MRRVLFVAAAAAALTGPSRPAAADPIGPNCETCQGSIYELLYDPTPVGTENGSTIWRITLRIDTSGYDGEGERIGDVAFKVSPSLDAVSLVDAPGGADAWDAALGGLSADGCRANGNNGFACARSKGDDDHDDDDDDDDDRHGYRRYGHHWGSGHPGYWDWHGDGDDWHHGDDDDDDEELTGIYEWVFDATVPDGTLFTGAFEASIKARYLDDDCDKTGALVSERITLQVIPEPGTLLLLGLGLTGLGRAASRRRAKS